MKGSLFYDITIIPISRFLGDNGKQSIPPNDKTIKRCIIHRSPFGVIHKFYERLQQKHTGLV